MIIEGEIKYFEQIRENIKFQNSDYFLKNEILIPKIIENERSVQAFLSKEDQEFLIKYHQENIESNEFLEGFVRYLDSRSKLAQKNGFQVNEELLKEMLIEKTDSQEDESSDIAEVFSSMVEKGVNCWVNVGVNELDSDYLILNKEQYFSLEEQRLLESKSDITYQKKVAALIKSVKDVVRKTLKENMSLNIKSVGVVDIMDEKIWLNLVSNSQDTQFEKNNKVALYYKKEKDTIILVCCIFEKSDE